MAYARKNLVHVQHTRLGMIERDTEGNLLFWSAGAPANLLFTVKESDLFDSEGMTFDTTDLQDA